MKPHTASFWNSGTALRRMRSMAPRSPRATHISRSRNNDRSASIEGCSGRAATMPSMPISVIGSAGANAGELDLDVAARFQARQLDDALGQIHDPHRLTHVKHIDRDIGTLRPE